MPVTLSPFGSYVLGTFGLLGSSAEGVSAALSTAEVGALVDQASQFLVDSRQLEPALRKMAPRLREATRIFHHGVRALDVPSVCDPILLERLYQPTKEGIGISNYFAEVARNLIVGGMTVAGIPETGGESADDLLACLVNLPKTEEPFPVVMSLLDEVQSRLEPGDPLRRLVLEGISLTGYRNFSISEEESVLNRLLDVLFSERENFIFRDEVVHHWVKRIPVGWGWRHRLEFLLAWQKRVEATQENFGLVLQIAKYLYRAIPPLAIRDYFRENGKAIAEDPKAKLFLWLYHGEEGDYDAFARWRSSQADYTPAEPELSEVNEAWRSLEMIIRAHAKAKPFRKVQVGDREFEMSKILVAREKNRSIAIGLVPCETEEGIIFKARLFYHSRSQGGWRVSPYMKERQFVKGDHYTAATQLHSDLLKYLSPELETLGEDEELLMEREELLGDLKILLNLFEVDSSAMVPELGKAMKQEAKGEMQPYASPSLEAIRRYQPGAVYDAESIAGMRVLALFGAAKRPPPPPTPHTLGRLSYPEGFLPDFKGKPTIIPHRDHPLLGMYDVYIYDGGILDGRPIEWGFGVGSGRVWIEFVRFHNGGVNSYGSSSSYIDAGILQMKPLEYESQLEGLDQKYSLPFDGDYEDLAPILLALKPIREFIRNFPDSHYQFPPLTSIATGWNSESGILRLPPVDKPVTLRLEGLPDPELDFRSEKGVEIFELRYGEGKVLRVSRKRGKSFMEIRGEVGDFKYGEIRIADGDSLLQALDRFRYTCFFTLGRPEKILTLRRQEEEVYRQGISARLRAIVDTPE